METLERDGARLTLYRDGPDWDGPTMTVGKLKFGSPEEGADILLDVVSLAEAGGAKAIIGPMEGDTWHSYRLVTESDGRPPFLMEPTNGPHDRAAFEAAGFTQIGSYFSAAVPLDAVTSHAPANGALEVQAWDGNDPDALFAQVHALSCTAFAGNPFYKPIEMDAFLAMYLPFVPMMKRELILFARDASGTLQGFLFGMPNYADGPDTDTVILKTYASLQKGAGYLLSSRFYQAARNLGYKTAIHALMHDDNLSALRSATNGADVFRRYGLMGRRI